jgi:hypothetical protein
MNQLWTLQQDLGLNMIGNANTRSGGHCQGWARTCSVKSGKLDENHFRIWFSSDRQAKRCFV